jgi:hypothetical protein
VSLPGQGRSDRLWFYVQDYPDVREYLDTLYLSTGVEEWSAEPGRVGGFPNDADVTVYGTPESVYTFADALRVSGIEGLMIEGEEIA